MEEDMIVGYGVLALHTLQNSGNKDMKIKDLDKKDLANEIRTVYGVYSKEVAIQRSKDLLKIG